MGVRTMVVIAAVGVSLIGCADADEPSASPSSTTPSSITTSTVISTTASTTTTTTPAATTAPQTPRGLGTTAAPDDEPTPSPDSASTDEPPTPTGERPLSEIQVGECIDVPGLRDPAVTELTTATAVACDEPHDAEVYARVSLNDDPDAEHPGDEHVSAAADQLCFERFEPYVGTRYVDARLEIVHLRPTVAAWQRGDRSVACALINAAAEPLSGSMAAEQ